MLVPLIPIIIAALASPAHAYLDPGTGSMLLYALAGVAAALAYLLRGLFQRAANLAVGSRSREIDDIEVHRLVLYSEGGQYWSLFSPVIRALEAKGVQCTYLTSDKSDEGLRHRSSHVTVKYLGGAAISAAALNRLAAELVVMTTPQLGVFQLKRSKHVQHYTHLIHSPTGGLHYKRYAFDHFDSVMCSGPHQIRDIRALERKRGMPEKELLETGLTYYDFMLDDLPCFDQKGDRRTVLIAPTWGPLGLITRYGTTCIRPLLDDGSHVILRPHPQSYVSEWELMREIEDDLKEYHNLTIDRSAAGATSMAASDLLISDLSGVIFDYAFLFSKPVIVVDSDIQRGGFEAEYVEGEIWEVSAREKLGRLIAESELSMLPSIVEQTLQSYRPTAIETFREKSLYNFGSAGETAANQLVEIMARQRNIALPSFRGD